MEEVLANSPSHRSLDDDAMAGASEQRVVEAIDGEVGVGDLRKARRGFGREAELSGRRDELPLDDRPCRWVRDDGRQPPLAGRSAHAEVAAQAPPRSTSRLRSRRPAFDDRDGLSAVLELDANLVPSMVGNAIGPYFADPCNVAFG
jgi:hypothetical protein